ncbi:MAG: Gfo/Idh/MocA family oxidoreductase [Clostridia bacterium]|nr:Gfo/Idh/MocA family oxidoreductase [Clostridia bacterium]
MDKIRIGMLGAWRGNNYIDLMLRDEEIELTAVCDRHAETLNSLELPATVKKYTEFEDFLAGGEKAGMNAVFLCNYFHQHAPFAIKAMEAGMDVVSECTSAGTMKECVELVRAVERTGRKYMIAENYPFSLSNMEIARLCRAGKLGTPLYAEGEYNHSGPTEDLRRLSPGKYHWRAWLPRTYYVTHAMGPLMYMTDSMPKYVSGRSVYSPAIRAQVEGFRNVFDGVGMMSARWTTA